MNKRPFLFGLGIGIILGAALLQLMLIGERQATSLNDYKKQEADQTNTYTQADLDKRLAEERVRIQAEMKVSTSKNEPKSAEEPIKSAPVKEVFKDKPVTQQTESKEKRIIMRIPPNSSVTETADLLVKNGVIKDRRAFINLMRKVIIRAGYFAFDGKPTLKEIKTIITGKPIPPSEVQAELKKNKVE
ncbi:hypothetical protein Back11_21890 [Paenibacillus baekrokdamisoli]|uniref:Uncharacterized protein n=1 Tax=Paenibacillus baekrokdamisoli TaxID=1712516 RepID=A0A3G9JC19_9BACL|nr:hypothetical protein [Paenibacillus baekrokdamisoli]MBB3069802.1 hypothetical protein [Paenibacillus baekrokdamisoli]BBH20844.1 hypothetical protein Back11_21890 [Paenibacillus baekrokdamisoli]